MAARWLPGAGISTPHSSSSTLVTDRLAAPRPAQLYRRLRSQALEARGHRRFKRLVIIAANVVVIGVIVAFVMQNSHSDSLVTASAPVDTAAAVPNPLDQLSSVDIAQTVAQLNNLPETTAIANQVQSQNAEVAVASSDDNVISKPQVVATALKSRADIQTYVTEPGDTITSLAARFGITSDSIIWSNSGVTAAGALAPGTKLIIPPVTGIVYSVKSGDTPASLAAKFGASEAQIVAYNDAEIGGLTPGEQIIIPGATEVAPSAAAATGGTSFPWGGGPLYGYNGYDFGYCTWYVATQIPVPANWGNAATWAYYAGLSGWNVSTTPSVGSIAQTADAAGGEGHVAVVTGVNPNGTVVIREMNGAAGWDRVDTITRPASSFQHYIAR